MPTKLPKPPGPANHAKPWPPFRVLCVDDNRDSADSAVPLLKTMGFEARACYDGPTALHLNDSFRPAICFLDLNMPGMDGDEVALKLREGTGWRPLLLIAVTAMSDQTSRDRTRRRDSTCIWSNPSIHSNWLAS